MWFIYFGYLLGGLTRTKSADISPDNFCYKGLFSCETLKLSQLVILMKGQWMCYICETKLELYTDEDLILTFIRQAFSSLRDFIYRPWACKDTPFKCKWWKSEYCLHTLMGVSWGKNVAFSIFFFLINHHECIFSQVLSMGICSNWTMSEHQNNKSSLLSQRVASNQPEYLSDWSINNCFSPHPDFRKHILFRLGPGTLETTEVKEYLVLSEG